MPKRLSNRDLREAASTLRRVLAALPKDGEDPHSRAQRRRAEGAICTLEVLVGVDPSTADDSA
jgi:hypothetical protein